MLLLPALAYACEPLNVTAVFTAVDATIDAGTPEVGLDLLTAAWNALPEACPVAPAELARLAWRASGHAALLGRDSEALTWAEWACAATPDTAPPPGRTACVARPKVGVQADEDVLVDGVPLAKAGVRDLPAGVHVVHWQVAGEWEGGRFTLDEGLPMRLPGRELWKIERSVASKRPSPLPWVLLGAGGALAGAGGVVFQTQFADKWSANCAYEYQYVDDGWRPCEVDKGVSLSPGFYGGVALIAGGAAIGVTGLALGLPVWLSTDGRAIRVSGRF